MPNYLRARAAVVPFVAIWVLYFALLYLQGLSAKSGNLSTAVFYEVAFVGLVLATVAILPLKALPPPKALSFYDRIAIFVGLAIGVLALASLFGDRMIQGISYADGVCYARGQMTRLGQQREGVSSIFSVLGQLLGYAYFVPAAIVTIRQVSRKTFWGVIAASFAILMLQSEVAASRSTIMLFGMFGFAAICLRVSSGKLPRIRLIDVAMSALIAAAALGFILNVFACRATASKMTTEQYYHEFEGFLGASPSDKAGSPKTDASPASKRSSGGKLHGLLGITALYATHSAFTFASIVSLPPNHYLMTLSGPAVLLKKIGIDIENGQEQDTVTGRFPSMPGSFYNDFGVFGILVVAVALGVAMWLGTLLLSLVPTSLFMVGFACAVLAILYVSPLLFALNIMAFPFVCFAFVAVPAVSCAIAATLSKFPSRPATRAG